ncbi:MAG TPA: hypothetical protein PK640_17550 [Verrucomicrobiota bacterium]|nr:hypothetical protein [Verrucomicrobiota bacterium]
MNASILRRLFPARDGRGWAHTAAALMLAAWVGQAVTISVEDVSGAPGAQLVARVWVDQASGIAGGTFRMIVPDFASVDAPTLASDTAGFVVAARVGTRRLDVSMARAAGMQEGQAILFTVPIRIGRSAPEGTFAILWEEARLFDQTTAPIQPITTSGAITVLPLLPDLDQDGLPDSWETERFGHMNSGAADDPDADGASNFSEYLAGTDPASAGSLFVVTARAVPSESGEPLVALDWEGQPGRNYEVFWSPGPLGPDAPWLPVYHPVYRIDGNRHRWIDDGTRTGWFPFVDGERYYQVRVDLP